MLAMFPNTGDRSDVINHTFYGPKTAINDRPSRQGRRARRKKPRRGKITTQSRGITHQNIWISFSGLTFHHSIPIGINRAFSMARKEDINIALLWSYKCENQGLEGERKNPQIFGPKSASENFSVGIIARTANGLSSEEKR